MSTLKNTSYSIIVYFIKQHQNDLYRLAYSYVKNKEAAFDVVQESIYKALSSAEALKNSSHLKTWIYRIVINTSINYIRKNQRLVFVEETPDLCQAEGIEIAERMDLYEAIDTLNEEQRTVIILRYFEDLKFDEIARVTNTNINTIKSRLYSAIGKLKSCLKVRCKDGSEF